MYVCLQFGLTIFGQQWCCSADLLGLVAPQIDRQNPSRDLGYEHPAQTEINFVLCFFQVALRIAKDPRFQRLLCDRTYADDCIVERVTQQRIYIVGTNDRVYPKACPCNHFPVLTAENDICAEQKSGSA